MRAYDLRAGRLLADPVTDKRESATEMQGAPISRVTSQDGSWAYTLYARQGRAPFVHALDTVKREAFCVDLPIRLNQQKQMGLHLRFSRNGGLDVRNRRSTLAVVDLEKLEARTG